LNFVDQIAGEASTRNHQEMTVSTIQLRNNDWGPWDPNTTHRTHKCPDMLQSSGDMCYCKANTHGGGSFGSSYFVSSYQAQLTKLAQHLPPVVHSLQGYHGFFSHSRSQPAPEGCESSLCKRTSHRPSTRKSTRLTTLEQFLSNIFAVCVSSDSIRVRGS
jgi:hypothetical protein